MIMQLASGGNINAQDVRGYTPIYLAALRKHNQIVEFLSAEGFYGILLDLKRAGADLQAQDVFGATALHAAVALGNLEVLDVVKPVMMLEGCYNSA